MKKISIIILVFALLTMLALIAPALAEAPTMTPIKAVQSGSILSVEKEWTTNGGIRQMRGVVNAGTIALYIPETASSPTYIFNMYNVYDRTNDVIEGVPITVRVNASWIYKVGGQVLGTFEGRIEWNFHSPHIAHGLLQGTGVFEGQTLRLWVQYSGKTVWYGTLQKR